MNEQELNATLKQMNDEERNALVASVKKRLPFVYTTRGNIMKHGAIRVSGKNAPRIMSQVSRLERELYNTLIFIMPDYEVELSKELTKDLRESGLIAEILLAGYRLIDLSDVSGG